MLASFVLAIPSSTTLAWKEIPIVVYACDKNSCKAVPAWETVSIIVWAQICPMQGNAFICDFSKERDMYANIVRMQELNTTITKLEQKFAENGSLSPLDQELWDQALYEWAERSYLNLPSTQHVRLGDKFASNKPSRRTSVLLAHHHDINSGGVFYFHLEVGGPSWGVGSAIN